MNNAHVESLQLLATPFREDTPQPFTFGPGLTWAGITADIRERIPITLRHRLTPPPETYSPNRCVYRACFPRLVLTSFVES
jgi:aarF domain-containing kinase